MTLNEFYDTYLANYTGGELKCPTKDALCISLTEHTKRVRKLMSPPPGSLLSYSYVGNHVIEYIKSIHNQQVRSLLMTKLGGTYPFSYESELAVRLLGEYNELICSIADVVKHWNPILEDKVSDVVIKQYTHRDLESVTLPGDYVRGINKIRSLFSRIVNMVAPAEQDTWLQHLRAYGLIYTPVEIQSIRGARQDTQYIQIGPKFAIGLR